MTSLVAFLRHVLPAEGFKCAVILGDTLPDGTRSRKQRFFATFEDLAAFLSKSSERGKDAYFACSSYQTVENRKKTNVLSAQALWIDIDCGPGKPYADAAASAVAVQSFCQHTNLPLPTTVCSGRGLHCYWPLSRALPPVEWTRAATNFKALCNGMGLAIDQTRTADSASVLRPIETLNWKDKANPLPVFLVSVCQPIDADAILAYLCPAAPKINANVSLGQLKNETYEASHGQIAVEHCAQLKYFRDKRGNVSEPEWYAALGVLAHCEDGDELGQEWSSGHPGYSADATRLKLEHARTASGPTTCDRFRSLRSEGCAGCPYQVSSPIQLGRKVEAQALPTITPPEKVNGHEAKMPDLPFGFKWGRGSALVGIVKSGNDNEPDKEVTLSRYPIYLRSIQTTEQGYKSSLEFGTWLPHDGWKFFCLPAKEFYSNNGFSALAENGVNIHTPVRPHFTTYVQRAQDELRQRHMDAMRFEQFGWKPDGSFLAGPVLYRPSGVPTYVAMTDDLITEAKKIQPSAMGSVGEWGAIADQLFAKGREVQGFTMLAGFAAPLLQFCGSKEGGVIISLESNKSGTGKSTAAYAALSIWGKPEEMKLIQRDNQVPLFHTFAQYRNLPILFDDMTKRDPQMLRDLVISFTDGRDKKRGQRDGTTQRTLHGWNTILITTSNRSMVDILQADGDTAQTARVLEFHMPEVPRSQIDNSLIVKFSELSGHAGPPWANFIAQQAVQDWLKRTMPGMERYYMERLALGGDGRFLARLLASVDVSARLLTKSLNALHFDADTLMDWATEQAKVYAKQLDLSATHSAVSVISRFINDHMPSCLVVEDKWKPRTIAMVRQMPRAGLAMRYEMKENRIFVSQVELRQFFVDMRVSYRDMASQLQAIGAVRSIDKRVVLGAGTDLPGGQVPVWEIDLSCPQISGQLRAHNPIGDPSNVQSATVTPLQMPQGSVSR